jgi:hypothetical protein
MKNVKKWDLLNAAPEKIVQSETEIISFPLLPWSS